MEPKPDSIHLRIHIDCPDGRIASHRLEGLQVRVELCSGVLALAKGYKTGGDELACPARICSTTLEHPSQRGFGGAGLREVLEVSDKPLRGDV
jgi:hypothetical protein